MYDDQIHFILSEHKWNQFANKWYMWVKYAGDSIYHAHVGGPDRDHLTVYFTKRTPPSEESIHMTPGSIINTREKLKEFLTKNNL